MKESCHKGIYNSKCTYGDRNLNKIQIYDATKNNCEFIDNEVGCDNSKLESSLRVDKVSIKILNDVKRTNRPFSYCIAMDFHPLDLSIFDSVKENNFKNNANKKNPKKSVLAITKKWFKKESRIKESYNESFSRSFANINKSTKTKCSKSNPKKSSEHSSNFYFNNMNILNNHYNHIVIINDEIIQQNDSQNLNDYQNFKKANNKINGHSTLLDSKNLTLPFQYIINKNLNRKRVLRASGLINNRIRSFIRSNVLQTLLHKAPTISTTSPDKVKFFSKKIESNLDTNDYNIDKLSQFNIKGILKSFHSINNNSSLIKNKNNDNKVTEHQVHRNSENKMLTPKLKHNLPTIYLECKQNKSEISKCSSEYYPDFLNFFETHLLDMNDSDIPFIDDEIDIESRIFCNFK